MSERVFKPAGIPVKDLETVIVLCDEFEAIRLCDIEKLSQIEAAERMGVSRGTVQRLLEEARFKVADALLSGKAVHLRNTPYCRADGNDPSVRP